MRGRAFAGSISVAAAPPALQMSIVRVKARSDTSITAHSPLAIDSILPALSYIVKTHFHVAEFILSSVSQSCFNEI